MNIKQCRLCDRCVPLKWVCDGNNDCGNAEDEAGCGKINYLCMLLGNICPKLCLNSKQVLSSCTKIIKKHT